MNKKECLEKDAIIEYLTAVKNVCVSNEEFEASDNLGKIILEIKNGEIPAADVAPVAHGYWESSELQFENDCTMCSECKTEFYIPDLIAESGNEYPNCCGYCPNCGAKMDGEPHDP